MNINRQKTLTILVILITLFIASLSTFTQVRPAKGNSDDLFARIDSYVEQEMSRSPNAGLVLGIVHQDQIVHSLTLGVANPSGRLITPQTPFDIGSVGKTFTALAIQQLAANGQIDIDDPVQTVLPWFRVADPDASKRITIRQAIDQTSGIPWAAGNQAYLLDPRFTLEQLVHRASTIELNRPVGQSFEYSNMNYLIAGAVIEAVSGMSYDQYIQANIFNPLEMEHSYLSQPEAIQNGMATGYRNWFGFLFPSNDLIAPGTYPMGHAICSVEDMGHFLIAYLNDGVYEGINIVHPGNPVSPQLATNPEAYFDLHWYIQPGPSYNISEDWSGGSFSYNSDLLILPGKQWGVIILINSRPDILVPTTNASSIAIGVSYILQGWKPEEDQGLAYWQYYLLIDLGLVGLTGIVIFQLVQQFVHPKTNKTSKTTHISELAWIGVDLFLGSLIFLGIPLWLDLSWLDLLADFKDLGPVLLFDSVFLIVFGIWRVVRVIFKKQKQVAQLQTDSYNVT